MEPYVLNATVDVAQCVAIVLLAFAVWGRSLDRD